MTKAINNGLSEAIKAVLMLVAMCYFLNSANAQVALQINPVTQKASCRFRIPMAGSFTIQQAFEKLQQEFQRNPAMFTRTNDLFMANAAASKANRNFTELDAVFGNATPVQSVDPQGNRMAVRVMTKYYSSANSRCLQMMYVQYYMVMTVTESGIEIEMTDIRYNHFNKKNYQLMRIASWSDFTSCDPISTMEYLMQNETCHSDFSAFASFFNNDVEELKAKLAAMLQAGTQATLN